MAEKRGKKKPGRRETAALQKDLSRHEKGRKDSSGADGKRSQPNIEAGHRNGTGGTKSALPDTSKSLLLHAEDRG